jgi:hypothetical protein
LDPGTVVYCEVVYQSCRYQTIDSHTVVTGPNPQILTETDWVCICQPSDTCEVAEEYTAWTPEGIELLDATPPECVTGVWVVNQGPFTAGPLGDFTACWTGAGCRQADNIMDPNDPCYYPSRLVQITAPEECCYTIRVYFNTAECVCLDNCETGLAAVGYYNPDNPCCWEDRWAEGLPIITDENDCCYIDFSACGTKIFAFRSDGCDPQYLLPVALTAAPSLISGDRQITLKFNVDDEQDVTSYQIMRDGALVKEISETDQGSYT